MKPFLLLTWLVLAAAKQIVPSAPRNLQVVLVSSNEVKLTWERPEADNGRLMGYYVYKEKLLNGSPVHGKLQKEISIMDPQKMSHEIRDLEPNTEYAFRVNAFNRNGDGEFSESRRVLTGGIPPRQPEMQSVVLLNDEAPIQARVEWKRPQLAPLEAPIDRFNVWYRPEGAASFQKKTVNGTETSAVLDDLWMGRVYEIVVSAESEEGASANATEQLVTPVGAPDSEPINVQYEIGEGKMRVSWDAPVESRRNGNITSYLAILTPMDAEGKRMEHQVKDGTSTSFKVEPRTSYTFKVSASTMKGSGPFSPVLTINPDPAALVGPPTNVRVEATSNSSAVIQWDFEGGQVDGFVVKYMHEPGSRTDTERWTARTVMNTGARHLEVPHLTAHKPYAFCVLAIRQNRQGSCSDPPTLISSLQPTYMVSELVVEWKTASSVKLRWQYDGPKPVGFYLNHTGKKEYFDHNMALKTMASPGFRHELDGAARDYLWTNLRPYMQYTFHVGVRSLPPGGRQYWPKEVVVVTDATGPPFVEVPVLEDIGPRAGQAQFKLRPASEEYGPISHYWLIIVPGNYSKDDMMNVEPSSLEQATHSRREQLAKQLSIQPAKKVKKDLREDDDEEEDEDSGFEEEEKEKRVEQKKTRGKRSVGKLSRHRRSVPQGAYVAARIQAEDMRQMFKNDAMFTVGDEKMYHGFTNFPLEPSSKYKVMMRAFAKNDPRRRGDFDQRPPMTEKMSRLYSDSELSEPFTTRAALKAGARSGSAWLLGPLVALFIIAILIGMLVCWWLRCNKKSAGRNHRHGSITKVALNGSMVNNGGMASETSKLLSSDNYGRTVMNPYEQLNGNCAESSLDLYPMMPAQPAQSQQSQQRYAVPVAVPCLPHAVSIGGGTQMTHPAIPISELAHQIERMRMNNNAGFQQEFESIETGQHFTWEHSSAEANRHKNRYANVVAYDHSRVTLTNLDGLSESEYINANYIDGYDKPKAYIATQGPLCETFADFWRMVWEEGSMTIVMLTNLEERSRVKCDQYWPTRGSSTYGDIQVTLLETTVLAHYTLRVLRVQVAGESEVRDVRHLQYTAWPDHGVPDHPTPFLVFLKRVKTLNPPEAGPIVTHCSAGIGRTGALIAIDCQLERLRYENTVDVCGCVTRLRAMRSYMVQTEEQYIFIYDAVLDAVNSGSTEVPAGKLYHHVQALMQIQPMENISAIEMEFRHLSTLKSLNSRCAVANLPANRNKNRQVNMVPYDSNRVIMQMIPGVDGSDYINASWVDGYRERSAYICTQSPTQQTAADLWRMVWEHEAAIVVMLTKVWEQNREKCCEYWPSESGAQVGQLVVEPIAEYNMPQYVLREFRLSDVQTGQSRTVRHFQYMEWPEVGAPKNAEMFIDFVQQVHRTKSQFGVDGPMVVHCYSGAGRSGVFVALAHLMDRMRIEHVVDVFTTVKLLRTERQNMVQDKEHYQFLYQAALEFLASYDQMIN